MTTTLHVPIIDSKSEGVKKIKPEDESFLLVESDVAAILYFVHVTNL